MEALRAAHMAVLTRVAERRPIAGLTAERIVLILRVVYSSDTLRQALFSTTIVKACQDVVAGDASEPLGPDFVKDRLERALDDLAEFTAALQLP